MKAYPETHQQGLITIEQDLKSGIGDFGIQIAEDGRIWICIDSIAAIRFKPIKNWGDFHRKTIQNHHQLKTKGE